MAHYTFNLSGVTFATKQTPALATAKPEGEAVVGLDPENPYKKHPYGAMPVTWLGIRIGYVPDGKPPTDPEATPEDREKWAIHEAIAGFLLAGKEVKCEIVDVGYLDGDEWTREPGVGKLSAVTVALATDAAPHVSRTKAPSPTGLTVLDPSVSMTDFGDVGERLESWNEAGVVVKRDTDHNYTHAGDRWAGVTDLVGACYKDFDASFIAPRCAKAWKWDEQDVLAMWENNRAAASEFGNALHRYLEAYSKWGERALPKMPFLREVVLSFGWPEGVVAHSEVLITSTGRKVCGQCDRLVDVAGGLRVEDYKANAEAEKVDSKHKNLLFPELPNQKTSKYLVQMSAYAEMLEESGHKVADTVVAHVFDGEWNHIEMPRIKGVLDRLTQGA